MIYFPRKIFNSVKKSLYKNKVLILYGARQVGKTALVKKILEDFSDEEQIYLNADEFDIRLMFESAQNFMDLKKIIGEKKIIVIDEAQRITDIGIKLKILFDNLDKDVQIIATGSSSFELANSINEPLTGRSISYVLFPLSIEEVSKDSLDVQRNISNFILYGSYPGIYSLPVQEAKNHLRELTEQYLFKDLLNISGVKKSDLLVKLLKLLAYQVGQIVSNSELAESLRVDQGTVAKYIEILEKTFVIFRLGSYSSNLRNEIKKSQKIYFFDLGMRNALINDFNELELRPDFGNLWENFALIERMKSNTYSGCKPNYYFRRNYDKQEVDLVEDWGAEKELQCFEFKYRMKKKDKFPKAFIASYPESSRQIIDKGNFVDLLALSS